MVLRVAQWEFLGGSAMPAIVEFPTIIQEAIQQFGDLFANDPQRRHFAEYLTGLIVARHKNVSAMQREFMDAADQSCLNRFLTDVAWDEQELNERRLAWLQQSPDTAYAERGVIALDNVLIDHSGKLIEDVGYFWDHAEQRHKIAHDYLFVNYTCPSGKHYPLEFCRFQKREQCEATGEKFQDHGVLFRQLVDWVCERKIPGDFAFDCYFSSAENLNYIHAKRDQYDRPRAYVADLKMNRKVEYRGRQWKLSELATSIPPEQRQELRRGDRRQWTFTCVVHLPEVKHPVRVVFLWHHRHDTAACKMLGTNRTTWEVKRIVVVYRDRWTGTETFHRDGKQELGMGDCQLRDGQGQTRHMYLVMMTYSLLMRQLEQPCAKEWASQRLTTIGQACRAILTETLRDTLQWAFEQIMPNSRKTQHVMQLLGLT
jgi:hypothetical protein